MTGYHPRGDLITRVEQAVAMGRTPDWIYEHHGVEPAFVDAVLARMDAAARGENDPAPDVISRRRAVRRDHMRRKRARAAA